MTETGKQIYCSPRKMRHEGMTLLEVMIAMLVLAAIVTMVSYSISASLQVVESTAGQGEVYHRAQVALQRISEDLTSALLVEGIEFSGNSQSNDGERGNILEFTSTSHIVFDDENDHPGVALISYTVKPDPTQDGSLLLLRSDDLITPSDTAEAFRGEGVERFLLSDRLKSVTFLYFNEEGDEQETWTSFVDDTSEEEVRMLPASVRITLEFQLDQETKKTLEFSTQVLLPVGLINTPLPQDRKNA